MTMTYPYEAQRSFFDSGHTKSYHFRLAQLNKLRSMIENNEDAIMAALYADLRKPQFEAYTSEIGVLYEELGAAVKNLKQWMTPVKHKTLLPLQPSQSVVYPEPLGVVLIIGPWNYPFQLLIAPLIGAIAAGNVAVIKPSDQTPHVSELVAKLIGEYFEPEYISVVRGPGADIGPKLIDRHRFDHIFFTGSPGVGKKIMAMAAQHLTPVTLELGGKSPVIVMADANLPVTAKRLVWAKFFNSGQTCVCPDYLLVHEDVKDELVRLMIKQIKACFGEEPQKSKDYGRIVNSRRLEVLKGLLGKGRILTGGRYDEVDLYMEPTLMDQVSLEDPVMQEEIFGPILPIITFKQMTECVATIRENRYPLALYLFTESEANEAYFIDKIEFGGGCINNAMVHLVNSEMPFGGVGFSGMGRYHGRHSFDTFSHYKSVLHSKTWMDQALRYAPYSKAKLKMAKRFLK